MFHILLPTESRARKRSTRLRPAPRANISAIAGNEDVVVRTPIRYTFYFYFQLQFGCVLRPLKVSCCTLVPSANMRPYLFAAGTAGLEHDVPSVRGPGREVVPAAVMRELHPLLAGDVHEVDIVRPGRSRSIFPEPGKRQKLPVRRP